MISSADLDQWEAEASPFALLNDFNALRTIALIVEFRKEREWRKKKEEALENYGRHDDKCIIAQWCCGEPTEDGRYRRSYGYGERQKWFYDDENPKCECGLVEALAIGEEK